MADYNYISDFCANDSCHYTIYKYGWSDWFHPVHISFNHAAVGKTGHKHTMKIDLSNKSKGNIVFLCVTCGTKKSYSRYFIRRLFTCGDVKLFYWSG